MSIEVACQCGKILKAKDEHLGLKAKCPSCGAIVDIRIATPPHPVISEVVDLPKAPSDPPEVPGGYRLADLKKALGTQQAIPFPLFSRVVRWEYALPEVNVGYLQALRAISVSMLRPARLVFAGDYIGGPWIEGAITSGLKAANAVYGALKAAAA